MRMGHRTRCPTVRLARIHPTSLDEKRAILMKKELSMKVREAFPNAQGQIAEMVRVKSPFIGAETTFIYHQNKRTPQMRCPSVAWYFAVHRIRWTTVRVLILLIPSFHRGNIVLQTKVGEGCRISRKFTPKMIGCFHPFGSNCIKWQSQKPVSFPRGGS